MGSSLKLTTLCYEMLEQAGPHVKVLICPQSTIGTLLKLLENHHSDALLDPQQQKNIHCLWPTPLAENVRNNIKKGNLIYDNEVVMWQYTQLHL